MSITAMKQALEALVGYELVYGSDEKDREAITSLRQAISEAEKRKGVGLTDDEMLMIYGQQHEGKKYSLGRMVEQALKEKNNVS